MNNIQFFLIQLHLFNFFQSNSYHIKYISLFAITSHKTSSAKFHPGVRHYHCPKLSEGPCDWKTIFSCGNNTEREQGLDYKEDAEEGSVVVKYSVQTLAENVMVEVPG